MARGTQDCVMGETGLEPVTATKGNHSELRDVIDLGGAESGAVGDKGGPSDPDLQRLIDAWPLLPEAVKAGILAMVRAVEQTE